MRTASRALSSNKIIFSTLLPLKVQLFSLQIFINEEGIFKSLTVS